MKEISLMDIVSALLQRWWMILISAVLCGSCAFVYCEFAATPKYMASGSAVISTGTSILGTDGDSSMKTSDVSITLALSNSFVDILSSNGLYKVVADKYDFGYSATELKNMTSVSGREDSLIADISVQCVDSRLAVRIVNAILKESQDYMQSKMPAVVVEPLDKAERAVQYSPRTMVSTALLAVVGAIISSFIIFLISYYDTTIKGEEDIARTFNFAILGSIPDFTTSNQAYEYKFDNAQGGRMN